MRNLICLILLLMASAALVAMDAKYLERASTTPVPETQSHWDSADASDPEAKRRAARLVSIAPDFPMELAERLAIHWEDRAIQVAEQSGSAGLRVLDWFSRDEDSRQTITRLMRDEQRFGEFMTLCDAPEIQSHMIHDHWRRALLELAIAGKIRRFTVRIHQLPDSDQQFLREYPEALPLFMKESESCGVVQQVIREHGEPAIRMLTLAALTQSAGRISQVASSIKGRDGERLLKYSEEVSPLAALAFVPWSNQQSEIAVTDALSAISRQLPLDLAVRLAAASRVVLTDMANHGRDIKNIEEFDPHALAELLRDYDFRGLADVPWLLPVLGIKHEGQYIGLRILKRFGPGAAEWAALKFGTDPILESAMFKTMLELDREYVDEQLSILITYADDPLFKKIFKRHELRDGSQCRLRVDILRALNLHGQSVMSTLAHSRNLSLDCDRLIKGQEEYWFLPAHTWDLIRDWRHGATVNSTAFLWAMIDDCGVVASDAFICMGTGQIIIAGTQAAGITATGLGAEEALGIFVANTNKSILTSIPKGIRPVAGTLLNGLGQTAGHVISVGDSMSIVVGSQTLRYAERNPELLRRLTESLRAGSRPSLNDQQRTRLLEKAL